jgi:guanylate kinase
MAVEKEGKCIIFSAPSGSGKTTIVQHLLKEFPQLEFSVSACSRELRTGEVNGKDYHQLGIKGFQEKIEEDAFIEWEEVYKDNYYGTLKTEIQRIWNKGNIVIFDVDVIGGLNIKEFFGKRALACFVKAPNLKEIENRLRFRSTETEEKIQMRLAKAVTEMKLSDKFDQIIINDDLSKAFNDAEKIIGEFIKK